MSRIILILSIVVLLVGLSVFPAIATCMEGGQTSGAKYKICMPDQWNGDLVVYAHGYVSPYEELQIVDDAVDGKPISEIINQLGYAFATTSYYTNGLVKPELGIKDLSDLVYIFHGIYGEPRHVYLVGASEGGLNTAIAVEQYPTVFSGGLAACGPVGNFRGQINYFGDFRVVFDYFFPDVIPTWSQEDPYIQDYVIKNWETYYVPRIIEVITNYPYKTKQLLRVTRAPINFYDPYSIGQTILGILWYNIFATNNAIEELGGQPFDNSERIYIGSYNDLRLNREIQRFHADQTAIEEIEAYYQTTGSLVSPLVTIHTTKDEIVPYWHETLYRWKVFKSGSSFLHTNIPIFRYGHCNFKTSELLGAFAVLIFKVERLELIVPGSMLSDAESQEVFLQLKRKYGALR